MKIIIKTIITILALAVLSSATTYYMSPSGSDSNPGTSSGSPWKTFSHAIPLLNAGDTLNLLNGTYTGSTTGYLQANCSGSAHNGTAGAPVTVQALNERQAFIQANGANNGPIVHLQHCSYWNLIGLHVEDGDFPSEVSQDAPIQLENGSHLLVRRNIVAHSNRCYNMQLMELFTSTSSLVEENEFYYFHRHSLLFWDSANNNESRRNYANPRNYDSTPHTCSNGTYNPSHDQTAMMNYGSGSNIMENIIGENVSTNANEDIDGCAASAAANNKFLGAIVFNGFGYGLGGQPHSGSGAGCELSNLVYKDDVVISFPEVGFGPGEAPNLTASNLTIVDSPQLSGGIDAVDWWQWKGNGGGTYPDVSTSTITNILLFPSSSPAFRIDYGSATIDHSYAGGRTGSGFSGGSGSATVTNIITTNPNLGACKIWIPDGSPAKGKGAGGADIGANVLYAYEGGALTTTKLWNPSTGAPNFMGAFVAGLNDVPAGSCARAANSWQGNGCSLFDIANRLNIGKNGCSFPVSYGGTISKPAPPTGLTAIVH